MTSTTNVRAQAEGEKRSAALSSVAAAVLLTSLKLVVGLLTGSLGILAEAAHSALDLVAALVTLFAVRLSDRPPDQEHLYGHCCCCLPVSGSSMRQPNAYSSNRSRSKPASGHF